MIDTPAGSITRFIRIALPTSSSRVPPSGTAADHANSNASPGDARGPSSTGPPDSSKSTCRMYSSSGSRAARAAATRRGRPRASAGTWPARGGSRCRARAPAPRRSSRARASGARTPRRGRAASAGCRGKAPRAARPRFASDRARPRPPPARCPAGRPRPPRLPRPDGGMVGPGSIPERADRIADAEVRVEVVRHPRPVGDEGARAARSADETLLLQRAQRLTERRSRHPQSRPRAPALGAADFPPGRRRSASRCPVERTPSWTSNVPPAPPRRTARTVFVRQKSVVNPFPHCEPPGGQPARPFPV